MIWFLRLLIGYWRERGALFCILIYIYLRLPNGNRRVFPAAYTKVPYPLLLFDSTGAAGIAASTMARLCRLCLIVLDIFQKG